MSSTLCSLTPLTYEDDAQGYQWEHSGRGMMSYPPPPAPSQAGHVAQLVE